MSVQPIEDVTGATTSRIVTAGRTAVATTAWSTVRRYLQAEGIALFVAGAVAYGQLGGPWLAFVPLLLLPDISLIGFARDVRLGAATYNLGHNLVTAGLVLGAGLWSGVGALAIAGAALVAHIGMDRVAGYGLKYPTAFNDTHLQRV